MNPNNQNSITEASNALAAPLLPYSYAKRHGVLLAMADDHVIIHHLQQPSLKVLTELKRITQKPLRLQMLAHEEFNHLLAKTYEADSNATMQIADVIGEELDLSDLLQQLPKTQDLLESQDDAPIIKLLNAILSQAVKLKASDIHIETFEERVVIRLRIDGVLREMLELQRVLAPLVISRIKVMARLDIAEKRLPQDGRISLRIAGHNVDVRVSTLPSNHGERVVLRLLDKKVARLDLNLLGMSAVSFQATQQLLNIPHGIILVTGPTGAGKTTTLYAALTKLNEVTRNILTVEDPIEYDLPGIGQTQVNPKIELNFAKGLRAILRQDPDVVMVGEIRDLETAEIAVQASLTGHLVLSTLHTNSAIGAITRLRDMGIEPFLLASSLIGVVAQRLTRLLCEACKQPRPATASESQILKRNPEEKLQLFSAVGCSQCNNTGYQGRTGIYEVVVIDEKLKQMIHENSSENSMEVYARTRLPSMRQDGFARVVSGETSIEEILRVTSEEG